MKVGDKVIHIGDYKTGTLNIGTITKKDNEWDGWFYVKWDNWNKPTMHPSTNLRPYKKQNKGHFKTDIFK